jgi:plasmid maintenance system antidote protein VapI
MTTFIKRCWTLATVPLRLGWWFVLDVLGVFHYGPNVQPGPMPPMSVGQTLDELYLIPRCMDEAALANLIDEDDDTVLDVLLNRIPLTPELSAKLATAFSTSPDYWLNIERAYVDSQVSH